MATIDDVMASLGSTASLLAQHEREMVTTLARIETLLNAVNETTLGRIETLLKAVNETTLGRIETKIDALSKP